MAKPSSVFTLRSGRGRFGVLAVAAGLLLNHGAGAQVQIAPGGGVVFVSSESKANGVDDLETQNGPAYGPYGTTITSHAHDNLTGADAGAYFNVSSSFDSLTFGVSSTGACSISGPAGAQNAGGAFGTVLFIVERTQEYNGQTYFDVGTVAGIHVLAFLANLSGQSLDFLNMITGGGITTFHGRIAPGSYIYFYRNNYDLNPANGYAATLTNSIGFQTVANPLITQHPHDQTVPAGSSASFGVGTASLASGAQSTSGTTTYQWRHGYQNMTNGGRISGALGATLQITSVAIADTGVYDCLVSRDGVDEPSSLARLTVTSSVSVGSVATLSALTIAPPVPTPFTERTTLRFSLPRVSDVQLDVLDVTGRRVKSLVSSERFDSGEHTVEWNGSADDGARAPAGVYFVELRAGSDRVSRRVIRMDR